MKGQNWKDIYGAVPREFHLRIEETLAGLEERQIYRRKNRILLVAALIAALLAGTAIAAARLGLFASAPPSVSIDATETASGAGLGAVENGLARIDLESGAYDGRSATLQLRVTLKDTENYALYDPGLAGEDEYVFEEVWNPYPKGSETVWCEAGECEIINQRHERRLRVNGEAVEFPQSQARALELGLPVFMKDGELYSSEGPERCVVGRKDGRKMVACSILCMEPGAHESFGAMELGGEAAQEMPDGGVRVWLSGCLLEERADDELDLICRAALEVDGVELPIGDVELRLPKRAGEVRRYRIEPVGLGMGDRYNILGGEARFTDARGYLTLDYEYFPQPEDVMGISLRYYDAAGAEIRMGGGQTEPLGGDQYREKTDIQTFAEPPETIFIGAKAVGGAMLEGRVACRLIPQ